mmetsp:Transcript_26207/g.60712  ORF Transcript_26207/g.60712 Transcript_26207/m.60712 type:complete len:108 (-) Transcript_26207:7-330(-)
MQSRSQALEHGATRLRKLPLKTFGPSGCCPVLNIDCVVRILSEWLKGDGNWQDVFEACLPGRLSRSVMTKRQRRAQRALERAEQENIGKDTEKPCNAAIEEDAAPEE